MRTYSELELPALAQALASEVQGGKIRTRVILEGPVGAGKSTFARALLEALGVSREAEGSPTFAIAHEYHSAKGARVIHADGYRLRSEAELEATGLLEEIWNPGVIVLFEWLELFPGVVDALRQGDLPTIWVRLDFETDPGRRRIDIHRTG